MKFEYEKEPCAKCSGKIIKGDGYKNKRTGKIVCVFCKVFPRGVIVIS